MSDIVNPGMTIPQTIPQIIMAGFDVGALSRDEIRHQVIHNWSDAAHGISDALTAVAFLVDGAKRAAEE